MNGKITQLSLHKRMVITIVVIATIIISPILVTSGSGNTLDEYSVYNLDTKEYFETIQEAIDDQETLDGHTIQVEAGTYHENVFVCKQLHIIGDGAEVTLVQAKDPNVAVFSISASHVDIRGFTVTGAQGSWGDSRGIWILPESNYNSIVENIILENDFGIYLEVSDNNNITNNVVSNNIGGIILRSYEHTHYSSNNNISNNYITESYAVGISLESCSETVISENEVSHSNLGILITDISFDNIVSKNDILHNEIGIELSTCSSGNSISDNHVSDSDVGINLQYYASSNSISNNHVCSSSRGFWLSESSNNLLSENYVNYCEIGFDLDYSLGNTLSSNVLTGCTNGFRLEASHGNKIDGIDGSHELVGIGLGTCVTLINCDEVVISNYIIRGFAVGIHIENGNHNELTVNYVTENCVGISLESCFETVVSENEVSHNNLGILITDISFDNIISKNDVSHNEIGIELSIYSSSNSISDNHVSNCDFGINLRCYASGNSISNNYVCSSSISGFWLSHSSDNLLSENILHNCEIGFNLDDSLGNTLSRNALTGCTNGFLLEASHGNKIDGIDGSYKLVGIGLGTCVALIGCDEVVISNYIMRGFEVGIHIENGNHNELTVNYVTENCFGISLAMTSHTTINNNIITGNKLGILVDSLSNDNSIYINLLINNDDQIQDAGENTWFNQCLGLGNFWSNYWGVDDGSNDRKAGDYIGDTDLPHEGVDMYPLLDPSIPMKYGELPIGDDWWQHGRFLVWRGGWSPVDIEVTDASSRVINRTVNEIGLNAFYFEETQPDGTTNVIVIIAAPPFNPHPEQLYSFKTTALADLTYSMEWFVSYGDASSGIGGEVLFERSVEEAPLTQGQTRLVEVELEMTPEGVEVSAVAQYDFGGFLNPINSDDSSVFQRGSTVPVKFKLSDDDGQPVSTAHTTIELAQVIDGVVEEDDYMPATSSGEANEGNVFRYDPEEKQFIFNLETSELTLGTYRLRITLDDGQVFEINITIV
ncbi:MAG: NosD domain-containing protein [Candidatus Hodarchaeales archaeon]|jgi:parallel beta-helix repeat protein